MMAPSSNPPLVSVIVPAFNAEDCVEEALYSASSQEYPYVELLVVDDGSTDSTARRVREGFPAAKLLQTENRGVSAARNLGTQESAGSFIQYLDADDILADGKLQRQVDALMAAGGDVAYGPWRHLRAKDGPSAETNIVAPWLRDPEIDLFTDVWCPPATYLFRRSIVERVGGWNESLPIIQDARFALDCALHGATFVRTDRLTALYRHHDSGSLSTRSPTSFNRDVLHNAEQVEAWWHNNEGLTAKRREAVIRVYSGVARAAYGVDPGTFEIAYAHLRHLDPTYIPGPTHLRVAARILGYRRAEAMAFNSRRFRKRVGRLKDRISYPENRSRTAAAPGRNTEPTRTARM